MQRGYIFVLTITKQMTTTNLIAKLKKMNIDYSISSFNGYNMDIEFTINGYKFKAGFFKDETEIQDYCREICYDQANQEMQRRFFSNFKQLLKYATNGPINYLTNN